MFWQSAYSLDGLLAALLISLIAYLALWQVTVGASHRLLSRKYGCKSIRKYKGLNTFPHLFSVKFKLRLLKSVKDKNFLDLLMAEHKKYGKTFSSSLFSKDRWWTVEVDNIKTILATNFADWGLGPVRKDFGVPLLGHGIFTNDGFAWENSRKLLRPNFARSQISDLEMLEVHIDRLLKAIPRDGSTVDLQDLFFRLTMDSATDLLFGESVGSLAPRGVSELNIRFGAAFTAAQAKAIKAHRQIRPTSWCFDKAFYKNIEEVNAFVDYFVHKAIQHCTANDEKEINDKPKCFIFAYGLAKRTTDVLHIRSELLNILLAGRDTTASLLSHTLFILARRPEVWSKLRAEISILGDQKPSYQQLRDFKYLHMVLNESLRLYPVVPVNARAALRDTVLPLGGGEDGKSPLFIARGERVTYTIIGVHRSKEIYGDDADEFKPERWETLAPRWEYLPFNGGPRICIGQQYALTEASYTIARLLQSFDSIEARDETPWTEQLTLTLAINQGTKVAMQPV